MTHPSEPHSFNPQAIDVVRTETVSGNSFGKKRPNIWHGYCTRYSQNEIMRRSGCGEDPIAGDGYTRYAVQPTRIFELFRR